MSRKPTEEEAQKAAEVLAAYVGASAEELLVDMKAGRLLRNTLAAKTEERPSLSRAETFYKRARCGDEVYEENDPRHVGTIKAIQNGRYREVATATIRWNETGWLSERVPLKGLKRSHQ